MTPQSAPDGWPCAGGHCAGRCVAEAPGVYTTPVLRLMPGAVDSACKRPWRGALSSMQRGNGERTVGAISAAFAWRLWRETGPFAWRLERKKKTPFQLPRTNLPGHKYDTIRFVTLLLRTDWYKSNWLDYLPGHK